MTNQKRYGLKAVNDEATVCELCGKQELKKVMWIVELFEDGESGAFPVGTTCGAKMLKQTAAKLNTKIKNFDSMVRDQRDQLAQTKFSYSEGQALLNKLRDEKSRNGLTYAQRKLHPAYIEYKARTNAAIEWANSQDITIEMIF